MHKLLCGAGRQQNQLAQRNPQTEDQDMILGTWMVFVEPWCFPRLAFSQSQAAHSADTSVAKAKTMVMATPINYLPSPLFDAERPRKSDREAASRTRPR